MGQAQRVTLGQLGHATVIVSYDPKDCQVKTITLFYLFSFKPGLRQVLIQMSESRVISNVIILISIRNEPTNYFGKESVSAFFDIKKRIFSPER